MVVKNRTKKYDMIMEEGSMSYQETSTGEGEPVPGGRLEEGTKSNRNTFIALVACFATLGIPCTRPEEYCRIKNLRIKISHNQISHFETIQLFLLAMATMCQLQERILPKTVTRQSSRHLT
jgi:hypothetical protein